ncbi:DDE-type integrase/transposase/recombinase, partial [Escherichia coli]
PNQVWSWDISYLPSWVRGQHFYLYMIVDIYSRKIIAAEVFASESGKHAAELLQRAVWNEKCSSNNLYSILITMVPCAVIRCWRKCMRLEC